jgi:methyl-accepting chemotaxis protein
MGYTIEQIVGRDHRMFCTQDYINDEMYGDLWRAMTQGLAETGEYIRVTSSGKHVWLQGSYNPCSMTRAMWSKSSGPARDITDGKIRAADHDGKMAAINRVHAVVEFSTSGSILSANDNFSTIFGYEREEVLGKHHRMFCDREDVLAPEYAEFWEKLAAGENHVGKFRRRTKDGRRIWISASYNAVLDPTASRSRLWSTRRTSPPSSMAISNSRARWRR